MKDHAQNGRWRQEELFTKRDVVAGDVRRAAEPPRPAAGAAAAAGGRRLETNDYNLKREVQVVTHKCNARTCPHCGRRRGWETRQVLLEKATEGLFGEPYLLTLTIDPKRFGSPEEAHDAVTGGGFIPRLLRLMGIRVWVWVLEFHKSGWPHWHILVDLSERGRLTPADMKRMWHLWRDRWGVGGLDLQERKRLGTADHAIMYVTKYLTKPPRHGFPAWFISGKRRRMVQASRAVGALCFKGGRERQEPEEPSEDRPRRESRPLVERMAECEKYSHLLLREINEETGEERKEIIGEVPVSVWDLKQMGKREEIPPGCGVTIREVLVLGGRYEEVVIPTVSQAEYLGRFLGVEGHGASLAERIEQRRADLLSGKAWKRNAKNPVDSKREKADTLERQHE